MATTHDNGPGVWPGFVAAFTGLVLSLLIMGMVMGISVYVLGQLPSLADKQPVHGPEARQEAAPYPPPPSAKPPVVLSPPVLSPPVPSPMPAPVAEPPRPVMTLDFDGTAVHIPRSAARDLADAVRLASAAGVRYWRIEITTDEQDLMRQRAAFLRLMAVRNVLLSSGIAAADIETRSVNNGPNSAERVSIDRVSVFSLTEGRKP